MIPITPFPVLCLPFSLSLSSFSLFRSPFPAFEADVTSGIFKALHCCEFLCTEICNLMWSWFFVKTIDQHILTNVVVYCKIWAVPRGTYAFIERKEGRKRRLRKDKRGLAQKWSAGSGLPGMRLFPGIDVCLRAWDSLDVQHNDIKHRRTSLMTSSKSMLHNINESSSQLPAACR